MEFISQNVTLSIVGGIIVLLVLIRLIQVGAKPKKCAVCAADTKDKYQDGNDTRVSLCRSHLTDRWKKEVAECRYDMVMIEPDFIKYPLAYLYATVDKLKHWEYPPEAQNKVSSILDSIKGQSCAQCTAPATVAYLKKEDYEFPFLENILATPTYLCKNCAIKRIEPCLRSAEKDFVEAVYAPTNGPGIYHPQEF